MVCIIWFSSIAGVVLTFFLNLESIRKHKDRSLKDETKQRRSLIRKSVHSVKFTNHAAICLLQRTCLQQDDHHNNNNNTTTATATTTANKNNNNTWTYSFLSMGTDTSKNNNNSNNNTTTHLTNTTTTTTKCIHSSCGESDIGGGAAAAAHETSCCACHESSSPTTTTATTTTSFNDCCAICLGDFKRGERVCFSKNKACSHVFHLSCAEEWLMQHSECPCCRASYILDKDVERESKFASFMTTCACFVLSQLIFRIEVLWVAIVSVLYVQQFASGREVY